jgi:EAL domain-containing protein (putative c-di-GMP-specific phosphodiesterase class I)
MQPIMSMTAPAESLDFEVLLRVRAPDGSAPAAAKVIATAEKSGDIAAIDTWVMTTVLEWFRKHGAALINTGSICVNLSASSINDAHFLEETLSLFMRFQDIVPYLCLQITENVALNNLASAQHFISRVHHKQYYPQALEWFDNRGTVLFCGHCQLSEIRENFSAESGKSPRSNTREPVFESASFLGK